MSDFSQSGSEIIRATHIFLFTVERVEFGAWEPFEGQRRREMVLTVRIDELLKGNVEQTLGQLFTFTTTQRGPIGRIVDYLGVWAHVTVDKGMQFLAFCVGQTNNARLLLTEPYLELLLDPAEALDDTRMALAAETPVDTQSAKRVMATAQVAPDAYGALFGRYFWALIEQDALTNMNTFEQVMTLLTAPQTKSDARDTYLTAVYDAIMLNDAVQQAIKERFIRALFTLLTLPNLATDLYNNIRDVYLPNLLRAGIYEPNVVFGGHQDVYEAAQAKLAGDEAAVPLSKWLRGGVA